MAHMIRIGRIDENVSGVGSRGYVVRRTGTTVVVEFGKIEATGSGKTKFRWFRAPKPRKFRFKSVAAARAEVRSRVEAQLKPTKSGGYQKLPSGSKILMPRPR
jgi:predicted DNA-binding WGR domain protein